MKYLLIILSLFLTACSDFGENWRSGDYAVYWIDNPDDKVLGYEVGEGAFIKRIDARISAVGANENYISAISCSNNKCSYFYIDRLKDHKYADGPEAVNGPYNKEEFEAKTSELSLPTLSTQI